MNPYGAHGRKPRKARRGGFPYRSRRGIFFGVCRGLAEHFDFSVAGMRLLFVVAVFMSGIWPMLAVYLVAALWMRVEPMIPLNSDDDAEFYNSYSASRPMALYRIKRAYDQLERRIQRLENTVTSRDYDWEQRLNGHDR